MPVAFIVVSLFLVSPAGVVIPYDTTYEAIPRDKHTEQAWYQGVKTEWRCADLQDQWAAVVADYYGDAGIRGVVACSYEHDQELPRP
ncbi:MAG: hypothetical protein GVY29_10095 [Spirochaetes bacterium]|jgi:hypothetical protein|nr:hypothetical protein [Spirochaetota bacterium]